MSIDKNEMEKVKKELENSYEGGSTSVRVRNDVYKMVADELENKKISITKFVTIATLEKLIRERG